MRTYLWLVVAGSVGLMASLGCAASDDDTTATPINKGGSGGSVIGGDAGNGEAGNGEAGNGEAGNGEAGSGQAGNGEAGSAGSGQAGTGGAAGSAGSAGSGQGGTGGSAGFGGSAGSAGMGGSGGGQVGDCPLSTNDAACDGCFQVQCNAECVAAAQDPNLNALLSCMQGCTDNTCMQNCANQFPQAYAKLSALDSCMSSQCATQCGGGNPGECGLTTNDATCDNCFHAACANECAAATNDPNLNALLGCLQSCGSDQSCMQNCVNQYPQAYAKLEALDSCMSSQCASQCGGGNPGECGLTTSDAVCDNCFHAACANECAAATNDPNLTALLTCMQGCGSNQTCFENCANQYPQAYAKLAALDSCMGSQCANECGGGSGGCGLTTNDTACDNCFHAACANECAAATADPNMNALLTCFQGCGSNQTCLENCANQYPTAYNKLAALDTCMNANCASQCGKKAAPPVRKFALSNMIKSLRSLIQ